MSITVKVEGFAELERALEELSKSAAKGVLRRALKKSAEPLADLMRQMAPVDPNSPGELAASIAVSTKLSKRQAGLHRKMFRSDRASVEMFVGPGPDPAAWNQEFGNINHGPQAFARPAWDQDKFALLDRLGRELWAEIDKTMKRAARKAARQAARG